MDDIVYIIDEDDIIIYISKNWDIFAADNSGNNTFSSDVLNKRLWSFINDPETVLIYKMLIDRVKENNSVVTIPFRCDSSTQRRYFEMQISKSGSKNIKFRSRLKRIEKREYVPLLDDDKDRCENMIKICSWCKKVYVEASDKWVEVEEAVKECGLDAMERVPILTHTICDLCMKKYDDI